MSSPVAALILSVWYAWQAKASPIVVCLISAFLILVHWILYQQQDNASIPIHSNGPLIIGIQKYNKMKKMDNNIDDDDNNDESISRRAVFRTICGLALSISVCVRLQHSCNLRHHNIAGIRKDSESMLNRGEYNLVIALLSSVFCTLRPPPKEHVHFHQFCVFLINCMALIALMASFSDHHSSHYDDTNKIDHHHKEQWGWVCLVMALDFMAVTNSQPSSLYWKCICAIFAPFLVSAGEGGICSKKTLTLFFLCLPCILISQRGMFRTGMQPALRQRFLARYYCVACAVGLGLCAAGDVLLERALLIAHFFLHWLSHVCRKRKNSEHYSFSSFVIPTKKSPLVEETTNKNDEGSSSSALSHIITSNFMINSKTQQATTSSLVHKKNDENKKNHSIPPIANNGSGGTLLNQMIFKAGSNIVIPSSTTIASSSASIKSN